MRKRMRAILAVALSLIMICGIFLVGCKRKHENAGGPDNENVNTPSDGKDDKPNTDDEPDFDPFSAEIYGVYLSDMDWEPNSLAGWVNDDFPQEHLI